MTPTFSAGLGQPAATRRASREGQHGDLVTMLATTRARRSDARFLQRRQRCSHLSPGSTVDYLPQWPRSELRNRSAPEVADRSDSRADRTAEVHVSRET